LGVDWGESDWRDRQHSLWIGLYRLNVTSGLIAPAPGGVIVPFAHWFQVGALNVNWAFQIDTLSVTMMLVVSGVGTLIHIYSIGYMHEDVRFNGDPGRFRRFFVYMNLFIAAMIAGRE
jgi:NADH-quinone oxidoreductase subunit L